jgi:hypothetical protein
MRENVIHLLVDADGYYSNFKKSSSDVEFIIYEFTPNSIYGDIESKFPLFF